jgi:hypothetical protein
MAPDMEMLGHAAFVKTDGTVFAHIHPTGTMAMAAFMMANPQAGMPGMAINKAALPNTVGFPYGFPTSGKYRIFVQMKHGDTVETGVFDAKAAASELVALIVLIHARRQIQRHQTEHRLAVLGMLKPDNVLVTLGACF